MFDPLQQPKELPSLMGILDKYAQALNPWATSTAARMLQAVDHADREAWRSTGNLISQALAREIQSTPVGTRLRELLGQQVSLITSLPTEAAQRVHKLTTQALLDSTRYSEIADAIARSGEVTESRAVLIARTEVSRTSTVLVQSRAEYVGMTHFVWRTVGDSDVRPGHRAMDGTVCEFASPPAVMENGKIMHFLPGSIWNCRCWADPVIDLKALRNR